MDRTQELEDQVRQLTERMARLEGQAPSDLDPKRSDRRGFLKIGAGAVLGALGWAAVKAVPASAASGGNLLLGCNNLAESATNLTADAPAVPVFSATTQGSTGPGLAGTFSGAIHGNGGSGSVEGVDGWAASATGWGVYGLTDAGTGVVGESNTGIGLYARRSGRIRQEGLASPGLPSYTPNPFEQVRDASGVLWIHNATGVWRRVNTPRADAADGSGSAFKPLRIVDTRSTTGPAGATGGPAGNGTTRNYPVAGDVGTNPLSQIPADAIAVFGNLTVIAGAQGGFLTVHPTGAAFDPTADPSTLNYLAHGVLANGFFCGLGTGASAGQISVYIGVYGTSKLNFIIDITGYVQ